MGVRPFGSTRDVQPDAGDVDGSARSKPSILDLGSVATGNEQSFDGSAIEDASGDTGGGESVIDPATLGGSGGDAPFGYTPTGRRRKRPVGSGSRGTGTGTGTRKNASEVSLFVGECLYAGFEILASLTKVEEFGLSEDESKQLGEAVVGVGEAYDNIWIPDPKTMAWIKLGKVVAQITLPRVASAKIRKGRAKGPQKVTQQTVIIPGPGANTL